MRVFFTADTHFGHFNIIGYCNRPFKTVEEQDEELIRRWNAVIKPEDTVWHLGDVCFHDEKNLPLIIPRLNGIKHLVFGNHDRSHRRLRKYFDSTVSGSIQIKVEGVLLNLIHDSFSATLIANHINLCGHVHERWKVKKGWINVGVDKWNFTPVSLEEIIDLSPQPETADGQGEEQRTCENCGTNCKYNNHPCCGWQPRPVSTLNKGTQNEYK